MNMTNWLNEVRKSKVKKAMPILSFPAIQLMGIGVKELISNADNQAQGMKMIADRTDALASVSMMDLSLEAEAFGSAIRVSDDEVPTVVGSIVNTIDDAEALKIPPLSAGRINNYLSAIKQACNMITDRPVFAGVIGPYSLAGRLLDVTEAMIKCYEEPELVHMVLDKVSTFLVSYINAYKETGANGVVVAEPLAGLLSPALMEEFAAPYMKRIVDATQDDDFIIIYHNCGGNTIGLIDHILTAGAKAYHFGNAIDMAEMLPHIPSDIIVMGNVDPAGEFKNGTPESIREATLSVMNACCSYDNFVISSGCDIPPMSKWENIDAFFAAVEEFYQAQE